MIILSGWLLIASGFVLLWRHACARINAAWVDFGWSLSFFVLVAWYGHFVDGPYLRRMLLTLLAGIWGLRLALHVLRRILQEKVEDPRYAYLRAHWGDTANTRFFWFFQGQAMANVLLAAPVFLLMQVEPVWLPLGPAAWGLSLWHLAGALWMLAAIAGEALADRQLASWKADPANRGKTCRSGLWSWSRHPNYFFEWLHWLAYPLIGLSLLTTGYGSWWPLTLLPSLVMLWLLTRITGIPYTEKRALQSRGEDYRCYQREVPAFFPRPPKCKPTRQ